MFLVVGAGRDDVARVSAQHLFDGGGGGADNGGVLFGHRGADLEKVTDVVLEVRAFGADLFQQRGDLAFYLGQILFDQVAAVDHDAAAVGDAGRRQAGIAFLLLSLAAVDGVDVERGLLCPFGDHRHRGAFGREVGEECPFHLFQHRAHVADGAVAEEGHGAVGDAALRLDLGPPDAAMAKADAVLVQRFGDDDVLDAGRVEAALFGEVGDAAIAAGFLIRRGADLDRAAEIGAGGDEGLGGDDTGGEAALHVAGPAAIDAVALHLGAEGVAGPAMADLDHVVMGVEMDAVAVSGALFPRDHVPARVGG